ncbi:myosin-binding protein H isoform X1 [Lepidochelys kempii]|uniref:myosin-binding protein H isoform X1 n=1 Tax=Lepidochelys kempii TaxID=8472 RepID=UPI003C705D3C
MEEAAQRCFGLHSAGNEIDNLLARDLNGGTGELKWFWETPVWRELDFVDRCIGLPQNWSHVGPMNVVRIRLTSVIYFIWRLGFFRLSPAVLLRKIFCLFAPAEDWEAANKELFLSVRYTIRNLTPGDRLQIRVKAVNAGGMSVPAVLEQPVVIREILEHPKIRVPRHLRQTYIRPVGEAVNLLIPFQGQPRPQVSWSKDGQPLDPKRVTVRNGDRDTIFFIRKAERSDSGQYQLSVKIDRLEDKATIDIRVIEQPGPPENLKLVDVWGFNVALEWSPPKDNGNAALKGYTVQKSDRKSGQWFTVVEHCPRLSCTVSDLIIGNSYSFRVFSENACGHSAVAAVTTELAHIPKPEIVYQPEKYLGRDFSEAPKFTQPLADRSTTRGYNTQLFCCVRAFPKPKIIWLKNQMEIREDPKYIAVINEGVCSLEIRKPSPFDGGVYTCKAVNPLGEASVDCRLDVKVPQ